MATRRGRSGRAPSAERMSVVGEHVCGRCGSSSHLPMWCCIGVDMWACNSRRGKGKDEERHSLHDALTQHNLALHVHGTMHTPAHSPGTTPMSEQKTKTQQTVPTAYHDPSWDHQTNTSGSGTDEEMRNVDPSGLAGDSGRLSLRIDRAAVTSTEDDDENKYDKNRKTMVGAVGAYKKLARFVGWVDTLNKNRTFFLIYQIFLWALLVFELYSYYVLNIMRMTHSFRNHTNRTLANETPNNLTSIIANTTTISVDATYFLTGQLITNFIPYFICPIAFNFYFHFRRDRPRICTMDSTLLDEALNTVSTR